MSTEGSGGEPMMNDLMAEHWLVFEHGQGVTGCHCGFVGPKSDDGWGMSVVEHFGAVAIREAVAAFPHGEFAADPSVPTWLRRRADLLDGGSQ